MLESESWKRIETFGDHPGLRINHLALGYKNSMIIFGGERIDTLKGARECTNDIRQLFFGKKIKTGNYLGQTKTSGHGFG